MAMMLAIWRLCSQLLCAACSEACSIWAWRRVTGDGLLAGCYFVFDVHGDVGQCGDRRRLCGNGFTLFGLDRLLTGALGVELEAETVHHLVHLAAEVGRLFFNIACSNCCLALPG
jgi:hypothetical protein